MPKKVRLIAMIRYRRFVCSRTLCSQYCVIPASGLRWLKNQRQLIAMFAFTAQCNNSQATCVFINLLQLLIDTMFLKPYKKFGAGTV